MLILWGAIVEESHNASSESGATKLLRWELHLASSHQSFDLQTFKYEVIKANGQGWADLDAGGDAVDDPDGSAVRVARQGVGNDMVLHLPWRLGACLHPVNVILSM